jgi:hypothetical protein
VLIGGAAGELLALFQVGAEALRGGCNGLVDEPLGLLELEGGVAIAAVSVAEFGEGLIELDAGGFEDGLELLELDGGESLELELLLDEET